MAVDPSAEIPLLRATVRDLLALSTIPEAWVGREPPAIASDLADLLIGSLELDFAFVRLCDPTGGQVVDVTRGNSWKAFPQWLQQHLAAFGQISRKEIVTNVGGAEESCCGIVIPVGVNSKRGFVAVASDRSDFPNQLDQQLLSVAANNAATAFQNAFLIKDLRSAQEALRANEQELRKARDELEIKVAERTAELHMSERELRDVVDTIPAIVWSALPDGSNSYANKRSVEYCGMTREQIAGSGWEAGFHPDDLERHKAKWFACVASGEPCEDEVRFRRADGQYRWYLQRGVPLRDEAGNIVKWYGVLADIEDRKRAEEALRTSEAYLAEAQRLSHAGSFGWKPDSGEIVWSDETYRIFEYDLAEKPTINMVLERVHPQDRALAQQVIDGVSRSTDFEHEYRLVMPSGAIKHIHVRAHALSDSAGTIEVVGAVTDITQRKTSEEKIRRLVDANILGIFIGNFEGAIVEANDAFLRMVQYGREDLVSGRLRWTDLTPPEWRERDQRAVTELKGTGTVQPYEKEFFRKDGSRVPVLVGGALFQEGGNEGVAFVLDLGEQKRVEDKIREQESELRQILDFAPWHVAVLGADGKAIYLNKAGLDYHGLTPEAFQDYDPRRSFHPDDRDRIVTCDGRAKLLSGQPFEIEARMARKDGKYRWFLFQFNPLRDGEGRITRWYVTSTDIEDRKQTEERLHNENVALREEIDKASMFEEIVGTSPALQTLLSRISKVAPSDSTVLITGETGTGKELVARAIHRRSVRASRAFVSVNCAAIPRDLIASELFGHEKGAFTGATQQRLGRFELANGSTLFLDEVGELPAETQIALLRVLQEHEFERIGGTRQIHVDVRVIAATNRDLQAAISAGSFRSDLFYRLNVFPIEVPPLRERREDIPLLVEYFIDRYARKAGKYITTVEKRSLQVLQSYPWPGNIRELQNVIERSVIVCETENFSVDESWLSRQPVATEPNKELALFKRLPSREKEIIEAALRESGGRVYGPSGAASKLGIPRSTLESKIRSLKISKSRFKP